MTNGEILQKLFPGFEEIQVFSEYILRNGKETIMKVDSEFWESEMREATPEERNSIDQYINSIAESIAEPCDDCISRQAALDLIAALKKSPWFNDDTNGAKIIRKEAVETVEDLCVKQLPPVTPAEDVPDTNAGDFINREDALMCLTGEWTELTDEVIHRFIKRIKNLPLMALPKQRTGRWEYVQYDGNPNIGNWHCSECKRIVCGAITAVNPVYAYRYCPECGAKMQEVENE